MDLGRLVVLLYTRLFEVHFLLIMLTKQLVITSDTNRVIDKMTLQHRLTYNDILSFIPRWQIYCIQPYGCYSEAAGGASENSLNLNQSIHFHHKNYRSLCIDTTKQIDSYVYMKGKFCLKIHNRPKSAIKITRRTYKLYVPLPLFRTLHIDISNIYPRFYKPVKIHCHGVDDVLSSISNDGILTLSKNILKTSSSSFFTCTLKIKSIKEHDIRERKLEIYFEPFTFVLTRRRRSLENQKRSLHQVFNRWQYYIDVKENLPVGHVIIQLNATNGNENYIFTKNANDKGEVYFTVNSTTGEVMVNQVLDRETGTTQFTIDVTATNRKNPAIFGTVTVFISMLDVNDNRPIFKKKVYTEHIKEERPPGRYILTVQATDEDEGLNKRIKYYLSEDSSSCPFKIDINSGVITNKEMLDREYKSFYSVVVKAEDQGTDPGPLSSTVQVNITIDDINDNKPIFEDDKYVVSIPENTPVNTVVLNVTATDRDAGTNGEVEYQPLGLSEFAINKNTGEISLQQPLDYDVYRGEFSFVVVVFDKGSPPNHNNVPVKIIVTDVNDNAPKFRRPSRNSRPIEIHEDKPIGDVIYILSARDKDSDANGRITYKFADEEAAKDLPFSISPRNGKVKVTKLLDYEKVKNYQFYVIAEDGGNPPMFAKASLSIKIVNVNDNAPQFKNTTYEKKISEDTRIGTTILTVTAIDPDGLDEDFYYSIEQTSNERSCFQIDQYSGAIFLRSCTLDYKKKKEYHLKLKVGDTDDKFGYANLVIRIFDANNNAPRFDKTVTYIDVKEDVPIGSSIGHVTARDDDSGENARISYSLDKLNHVFSLNTTTGELRTKQLLDREKVYSYRIIVIAQDHGKPYPKNGKTTVIISVLDVNDNAPIFSQKTYTISIQEDVGVGSLVGSVTANDADENANKDIRYLINSMNDGDGCFSIDELSGMIKTKKLLDREKKAEYKLTVLATDQAVEGERKSATAEVIIHLEDVQDSAPVFEKKVYTFTIEENSNVVVGFVKATLADINFQHSIKYRISKNDRNLFIIDMLRGGIHVRSSLDYEEKSQYILTVRVRADRGLTDEATVIVNVTDVNDNPPVLKDFYIFLNVINGTFDPKFKVPATDLDVTSKLTYKMISGNKYDFLDLNSSTGILSLQKSIVNSASEIKVKFEVDDGRFTTTAFGRIAVSELTNEMVENSIFIILNDTTREQFLDARILKKFRSALAGSFQCDSGRIFIVSIEESNGYKELDAKSNVPMLEVVVAVRVGSDNMFHSAKTLKDQLYLNQNNFTRHLGIEVISFDLGNEYWCSAESCNHFQKCLILSRNTKRGGKTISSKYVTFRGVHVQQDLNCTCPAGYGNGPDKLKKCSESYNLCYRRPCGNHGKCVGTDGGFTCICDPGFTGELCDINIKEKTCPKSPLEGKNPCGQNGKCENKPDGKGFNCICHKGSESDNSFCQLSTRSFKKESYIALQGLYQRWNFVLSFEFATEESNAVLVYNGRYSNQNDFIAVEITDGQVVFSVSVGQKKGQPVKIHTVKSFIPGGVNHGQWVQVKVQYRFKQIDIAVGRFCDITTASMLNPDGNEKHCSASLKIDSPMRSLDLSGPMLIGGLPRLSRPFQSRSMDFVGCIRDLKIDHRFVDLMYPMFVHKSDAKCKQRKESCYVKNPCEQGECMDGMNGPYCICPEGFVGKTCSIDSRLKSPVISLIKQSRINTKEMHNMSNPKEMVASIAIKTTQRDGVIWQERIDSQTGYLKIKDGYVCYVFDSTVVVNLTSVYISNGKWHEIKVQWKADKLFLSVGYGRREVSSHFTIIKPIIQLERVGGADNLPNEELIGCLQGFFYGGKSISLKTNLNKAVLSGCSQSSLCDHDPCGAKGKCSSIHGSLDCQCNPGYQGPKCVDVCKAKPCKNDGICVGTTNNLAGFKCVCPKNFTGEYCQTETTGTCKKGYYGDPGSGLCGPCKCKVEEDPVCDRDGTCYCPERFYKSKGTCVPCNCLGEGSSSAICDKLTGKCPCLQGVVGRKCDQCPGSWQELTSQCQEINTSCPKSYMEGIWWNRVPPGSTQVESCPRGAFGNATRYCHFRNSWSPPNLFGCVSIGFHNVKTSTKQLMRGNKVLAQKGVVRLANQLEYAVTTSHRLYGQDIEIGYNTIKLLIDYEASQTRGNLVSSDDSRFVWNLVTSASNLITTSVQEFWDSIQREQAGTAGVMQQMERFVEILASNFAYVKRRRYRRAVTAMTLTPYSEETENIYLEIQPISLMYDGEYKLPQHLPSSYKQSIEVYVTKKMFEDSNGYTDYYGDQVNIGMIVYKTLGELLPRKFDIGDRVNQNWYAVHVVSDVFSLVIPRVKSLKSDDRVKIIYRNIPEYEQDNLACAYWNHSLTGTVSGGWSDSGCTIYLDNTTDVTCHCDRHTSFALVSIRYTVVIPRVYQIDMFTYIGIGISMLLLMMGFLVFFCLGQLKSNANSIHKNLALVAFLAELVFAVAVNRPDIGENTCRIVAIIIHYFVTCTFCWLLVEALHMYRMILEPRDINYGQMMFYYFIGWGAPVMVVGVTAGLKPEGYGNNEFCWVSIKASEEITWTYLAPIMAVICGNIVLVFVAIIASCEKQANRKKKNISSIRYRLAISMVFLPLLGATVAAGLIVVSYDHKLFMYLFPIFCVLEGLYLIFFYVIFNRKVRREAKNAFVRWKTGDKTYGIKPPQKRMKLGMNTYTDDDRHGLRPIFQTFNIGTSSTSDSSDADVQRRKARIRVAGSETTDFPTTTCNDSSDSSEEDSDAARQRRNDFDSDSDSSDNSSDNQTEQEKLPNGKVPAVQWKQATQKKLNTKRTYASDGPMHSTPSDTSSDRKKNKAGFTPTKMNTTDVTVLGHSDSDEDGADSVDTTLINGTHSNGVASGNSNGVPHIVRDSASSNTESESSKKEKGPVSILKKKSQYDQNGKNRYVRVKDNHNSLRKPLMSLDDTIEMNDSQV